MWWREVDSYHKWWSERSVRDLEVLGKNKCGLSYTNRQTICKLPGGNRARENVSQIMCFVLTYSCTSHLTKRHSTVSMLSMFQYKPAQYSSGKVFALKVVGCGFQHRPDHIKVLKNGPHCLLAWHSVFGVGIWGLYNWVMGQPTFGMWQLLGLHWCSWLECGSRAGHAIKGRFEDQKEVEVQKTVVPYWSAKTTIHMLQSMHYTTTVWKSNRS